MDKHVKTLTELLGWWYWDNDNSVKQDNLTYLLIKIWIYDYLKYD